ncbi:MAG: glycosyltransferase family 4 protein [Bryobacteraceae bacterium]
MRVLHLDFGRQMRGGQYQAMQLIEELSSRGIEQQFLGPLGEPFTIRKLRRQVDLVHAHDAKSHTYAALFAKAPLIVSRRVAFPIKNTWASRWKYRQPVLFLAVSKYVAGKLMEAGVPSKKIEVIYDGVVSMPLSTRTGPVIAVASSDPMKGTDLIRQSGVDVEFTANLPEALRTARGLLYITREEGLGSAALLAMSAGVPVVASRVGGLPEIVHHERTGLLTANEPTSIAAAAARLHEPEADEWARQGREAVHARFLTSHMAEATLQAYKNIALINYGFP